MKKKFAAIFTILIAITNFIGCGEKIHDYTKDYKKFLNNSLGEWSIQHEEEQRPFGGQPYKKWTIGFGDNKTLKLQYAAFYNQSKSQRNYMFTKQILEQVGSFYEEDIRDEVKDISSDIDIENITYLSQFDLLKDDTDIKKYIKDVLKNLVIKDEKAETFFNRWGGMVKLNISVKSESEINKVKENFKNNLNIPKYLLNVTIKDDGSQRIIYIDKNEEKNYYLEDYEEKYGDILKSVFGDYKKTKEEKSADVLDELYNEKYNGISQTIKYNLNGQRNEFKLENNMASSPEEHDKNFISNILNEVSKDYNKEIGNEIEICFGNGCLRNGHLKLIDTCSDEYDSNTLNNLKNINRDTCLKDWNIGLEFKIDSKRDLDELKKNAKEFVNNINSKYGIENYSLEVGMYVQSDSKNYKKYKITCKDGKNIKVIDITKE